MYKQDALFRIEQLENERLNYPERFKTYGWEYWPEFLEIIKKGVATLPDKPVEKPVVKKVKKTEIVKAIRKIEKPKKRVKRK